MVGSDPMRPKFRICALMLSVLAPAAALSAQTLPAGPIELAHGQVPVAGDVTATFGAKDAKAYFNYTDYEHNALRMFRLSIAAAWRPVSRLEVLTQIRTENLEAPIPYALYVRVRPWEGHAFDIQAGRVPTVFGTFARRSYSANDNPLIGYPLAYQYLTSIRYDAIPASADDLLQMRGRGWLADYPVGSSTPAAGVPIVSGYRWDTGIQAHAASQLFDAAVSLTQGTLARPVVHDDNDGLQISGRLGVTPITGLILGVSGSRGAFLERGLQQTYGTGGSPFTQTAVGVDAEYSIQYWLVRGEWIQSRFALPAIKAPFITGPLVANTGYIEARYKITPRLFAAARGDMLYFSEITGQQLFGGQPTEWEAPVRRVELGGGVYIQRNLTARIVVQRDWRDGGRVREKTFVSGQLTYWF